MSASTDFVSEAQAQVTLTRLLQNAQTNVLNPRLSGVTEGENGMRVDYYQHLVESIATGTSVPEALSSSNDILGKSAVRFSEEVQKRAETIFNDTVADLTRP